jgi:hypothetical protein
MLQVRLHRLNDLPLAVDDYIGDIVTEHRSLPDRHDRNLLLARTVSATTDKAALPQSAWAT